MRERYSAGFIPIIFLIIFLVAVLSGSAVVYAKIVSQQVDNKAEKALKDIVSNKIETRSTSPTEQPKNSSLPLAKQAAKPTQAKPQATATSAPQGGNAGPTDTPAPTPAITVKSIIFNNQDLDVTGKSALAFTLPGTADVAQTFDIPVIVKLSNDSTKNLIIKFVYQTAPTPTVLPTDIPAPTSVQPTDTPVPTSTPAPISCSTVPGWTNTNGFWCKVSANISSPIYVDCPSASDSISSVLKGCMYDNECIIASGNYFTQAQGGSSEQTHIGTNFCPSGSGDIVKNRVKVYLHTP